MVDGSSFEIRYSVGSLAMSDLRADHAEEVVHSLRPEVARFVFDEGVRHTQALQTAAHALDARAAQVATILFAAAALSAGVIDKAWSWSSLAAVFATGLFIWGGLISFRGVRSDEFRAPGLEPAFWWANATPIARKFTEQDALAWAAKQQQITIDHICEENKKRSLALNASLRAGVCGAVCVAAAAVLKLWPATFKFLVENF